MASVKSLREKRALEYFLGYPLGSYNHSSNTACQRKRRLQALRERG